MRNYLLLALLFLLWSCEKKPQFVQPIPVDYIPQFQYGDSVVFGDSSSKELRFVFQSGGVSDHTYDWSGGKKVFKEGEFIFSQSDNQLGKKNIISITYSGIAFHIGYEFAIGWPFSSFSSDSLFAENVNGIQCNNIIHIRELDSYSKIRIVKYDFQRGIVAYQDTNNVQWTLKRMVPLR